MQILINLINTFYSFYSHNWELFYFGIFTVLCFIRSILKPSRFYVLLTLGFLILTFEFEYTKHLIPHVRENVTELILVDPATRKFNVGDLLFSKLLPIMMQASGWFLVAFSIFFVKKDSIESK